jgi:glucan endo-1,3-alpha-glucosidase
MDLCSLVARFVLVVCSLGFLAAALPNVLTSNDNRIVIAHYIIGNTFPYTAGDWKQGSLHLIPPGFSSSYSFSLSLAISLASSKGIDAFALDLGKDAWETSKVADAYAAAIGTNFKLFIMFDMASLPCDKAEDGNFLRQLINAYYKHSNQLTYHGKPVVGTFGGQTCRFGTDHMDDGWNNVVKTNMRPVHFIPSFFIEPPMYEGLRSADGAFAVRNVSNSTIHDLKARSVGFSVADWQL